jgi:hypothetical protein
MFLVASVDPPGDSRDVPLKGIALPVPLNLDIRDFRFLLGRSTLCLIADILPVQIGQCWRELLPLLHFLIFVLLQLLVDGCASSLNCQVSCLTSSSCLVRVSISAFFASIFRWSSLSS